MVCRVFDFKKWGVLMEEIKRFRIRIEELKWINFVDGKLGGYGGNGFGVFYNELGWIIDESRLFEEFNLSIIILRDWWKIDFDLFLLFLKFGGMQM